MCSAWAELYPKTGVVTVKVQGVLGDQGTVRGDLFNNKDSWLKYERAACTATALSSAGETVLRFDKVPLNDRYALSVYQDEYEGSYVPRYFECS